LLCTADTTDRSEGVGWDAAAAADAAIEIGDDENDDGDPHGRRFTDELFRQLATLQQQQCS